jgi:hypothetical protein
LKFSQGWEVSVQAQEGAQQSSDRQGKEIWTVDFYVQEGAGEAHRRGDRQSLDLIQKSHQSLDRVKVLRV